MSDQVSKPTTLYVYDAPDLDEDEPWLEVAMKQIEAFRPASRSEVIEALDIDYEAAAIAAAHYEGYGDFEDMLTEWPYQLTKDPDEQESIRFMIRGIVDAALGLEDDE